MGSPPDDRLPVEFLPEVGSHLRCPVEIEAHEGYPDEVDIPAQIGDTGEGLFLVTINVAAVESEVLDPTREKDDPARESLPLQHGRNRPDAESVNVGGRRGNERDVQFNLMLRLKGL